MFIFISSSSKPDLSPTGLGNKKITGFFCGINIDTFSSIKCKNTINSMIVRWQKAISRHASRKIKLNKSLVCWVR